MGVTTEQGEAWNGGESAVSAAARARVSRVRAGKRERDRGRKRWDEVELGGFLGLLHASLVGGGEHPTAGIDGERGHTQVCA